MMSTSQVRYIDYEAGDEDRLVTFFNNLGYTHHTPDFWKWTYEDCPEGKAIFQSAKVAERVVGHYATLPRSLVMGEGSINGALGIHLATHMDYRSVDIFMKVVQGVYLANQQAGVDAIYGFPNDNSWLPLQRLAQWTPVGDIPALEVDCATLVQAALNSTATIMPPDLRDRHSELLQQFVPAGFVHVKKSPPYLTWRYARHPLRSYYLLEYHEEGQLQGFSVLKLYRKENILYGHILEWGLPKDDQHILAEIIGGAAHFFQKQQVNIVSTWLHTRHPIFQHLISLGFRSSGFATHFGYRALRDSMEDLKDANWLLSMGDSDAF